MGESVHQPARKLQTYHTSWALIDWLTKRLILKNPFLITGKSSIDTKTAQKTKKPFLNDVLWCFRLVLIRDEMAMGIKTCKWLSLLVHFNLVNQKTEFLEYAPEICPEFAPKRFYASLSYSTMRIHKNFTFFSGFKAENWNSNLTIFQS